MENQKLVISPAPHVHGKNDTRRMMGDVLIALLPALVVSVVASVFGFSTQPARENSAARASSNATAFFITIRPFLVRYLDYRIFFGKFQQKTRIQLVDTGFP